MHDVNREAICIGIKYNVKLEPMYFKSDILQEILNGYHQRCDSVKVKIMSIQEGRSDITTNFRCGHIQNVHKDHQAQNFCNKELGVSLNVMAAFAKVQQRYITAIIMVKTPT